MSVLPSRRLTVYVWIWLARSEIRSVYSLGLGLEALRGGERLGGLDLGVRFTAAPGFDLGNESNDFDIGVLAHIGIILGT